MKRRYSDIIKLIRDHKNDNDILELLSNYHENDIADIISLLTTEERKKIYKLFGFQKVAEVFAYFEEPEKYLDEISIENAEKGLNSSSASLGQSKFLKNLTQRKRVKL